MKHIKVIFILLSLILFSSCENLINSPTNSLSFSLNSDTSSIIKRNIGDEKKITIDVVLFIEDKEYTKDSKNVNTDSLEGVTFSFTSLPLASYSIIINIKKDNVTLFTGTSNTVEINDEESDKVVDIDLKRERSSISLEPNGGYFKESSPSFYYPSFTTPLPTPLRNDDTFLGWYLDPLLNGNAIKTIGLHGDISGDIKLYAKWLDKNPSPVTELKAQSNLNEITLSWINPNINDFNKVDIS